MGVDERLSFESNLCAQFRSEHLVISEHIHVLSQVHGSMKIKENEYLNISDFSLFNYIIYFFMS